MGDAAAKYFAGDPRTNRERMLAGDLYVADDPDNQRLSLKAMQLSHAYHLAVRGGEEDPRPLLKELFGRVGAGTEIRPPFFVDYGENIFIGARSFINYNLTALDVGKITIGDDCQLGPNVQLLTPTHPLDPELRRAKLEAAEPIKLGDNVWLGGGVTVCPGVTIGDNSVIGAGAVVTKDVPPNVVAVGNPARVIRTLEPAEEASAPPRRGAHPD